MKVYATIPELMIALYFLVFLELRKTFLLQKFV